MPYFVSEQPLVIGYIIAVEGPEAAHLLKSRRLRNGERFAMQDDTGRRCLVELVDAESRRATVKVLEELPVPASPPVRLHLLQAAVKDRAAELIVQKATELGAAALSFFPAANSPLSLKQLAAPKTLARWEKIASEACKQCDRQFSPALATLRDFPAALEEGTPAQISWLLHPTGETTPAQAIGTQSIGRNGTAAGHSTTIQSTAAQPTTARVLVGPEGGFTDEEAAAAQEKGFTPVRLGGQILRAETAALAACALLLVSG